MTKKTTLDVAITQLGVKEATGNNDGIPAERYTQGEELPWCASLIVWCNNHSDDEDLSPTLKDEFAMRRVQTFEDRMKERGKFFTDPYLVQKNDIVFFKKRGNSDLGAGRHMGIVSNASRNPYGAGFPPMIDTVEGNTSNAVDRRSYPGNDPYITGFARINGPAPVQTVPEPVVEKPATSTKVPLVYVAAPYRAKTTYGVERNIQNARRWGAIIMSLGAYPVIPHSNTSHFDGLAPDEVIMKGTTRLMLACDLAVFLGMRHTDGGGGYYFSSGVKEEKDAWEADEGTGNLAIFDKDLSDAEAQEAVSMFLKGLGR